MSNQVWECTKCGQYGLSIIFVIQKKISKEKKAKPMHLAAVAAPGIKLSLLGAQKIQSGHKNYVGTEDRSGL